MGILTRRLKVVVVGRGYWGNELAKTAMALGDDVVLVGHEDAIPDGDIAVIATTPQHRVACAKRARAELYWLEVPLAMHPEELERLRGMDFTTGFRWRYAAPWWLVGRLRKAKMEIVHDRPLEKPWVREAGLWRTWGPHWVDILRQMGCTEWKREEKNRWTANGVEITFEEKWGPEPRRELILYGDRVLRVCITGWTLAPPRESGVPRNELGLLWSRFREGRPLVSTADALEANRVVLENSSSPCTS